MSQTGLRGDLAFNAQVSKSVFRGGLLAGRTCWNGTDKLFSNKNLFEYPVFSFCYCIAFSAEFVFCQKHLKILKEKSVYENN